MLFKPVPLILALDPSGAGPIGGLAISQSSGNLFFVNGLTGDWASVGGSGPSLSGDNIWTGQNTFTTLYTNDPAFLIRAAMALTGGGTGNIPTLTSGPVTGNPSKWLPIDDAGTTRYVPAW